MKEELKYSDKNNISHNWINLVKPSEYKINKLNYSNANFTIEPLDKGFATTLANSLRRIMLSSIYGTAICAVKIDGVQHEYSTIEGVKEDVSEIILNLKSVNIKGNLGFDEKKFTLPIIKKGIIRASMIQINSGFEIMNPSLIILTVTKNIRLDIELIIKSGKGYVTSYEHKLEHLEGSYIFIDSIFSPVEKCSFNIENSRVGSKTEFDKLVLNVTTNGTINVEIIPALAAKILYEQLKIFINFNEIKIISKKKNKKLYFNKNLLRRVNDL
jgi:DNA-directed RNA polymerase subunit alpha